MLRGLGFALLVLLVVPCVAAEPPFRTGALEPPGPAPEFTLRSDTGKTVRLRDWRGNVVLLYFGYTSCPDVCPTTLSDLAEVKKQLGPAAQRLRVALVTVDPERDTAKRLHSHDRLGAAVRKGGTLPHFSLGFHSRVLKSQHHQPGVVV